MTAKIHSSFLVCLIVYTVSIHTSLIKPGFSGFDFRITNGSPPNDFRSTVGENGFEKGERVNG